MVRDKVMKMDVTPAYGLFLVKEKKTKKTFTDDFITLWVHYVYFPKPGMGLNLSKDVDDTLYI